MIRKEVNKKYIYTKEFGDGAVSVLRLCEAAGTEVRNCAVITDSWFGGIMYVLGMSKLGLQTITMIKSGTAGYCKKQLKDKLKRYDIPRGEDVAAVTTIYGVKIIALA